MIAERLETLPRFVAFLHIDRGGWDDDLRPGHQVGINLSHQCPTGSPVRRGRCRLTLPKRFVYAASSEQISNALQAPLRPGTSRDTGSCFPLQAPRKESHPCSAALYRRAPTRFLRGIRGCPPPVFMTSPLRGKSPGADNPAYHAVRFRFLPIAWDMTANS
jgi:hypothetical protein